MKNSRSQKPVGLLAVLIVTIFLTTVSPKALAAELGAKQLSVDYYGILEIPYTSDAAEIKGAYRSLSQKYHPDKNQDSNAEALFKEINEAYSVLKSEKLKKEYDRYSPLVPKKPKAVAEVEFNDSDGRSSGAPPEAFENFKSNEACALWLLSRPAGTYSIEEVLGLRERFWSQISAKDLLVAILHHSFQNPNLTNAALGAQAQAKLVQWHRASNAAKAYKNSEDGCGPKMTSMKWKT